MSFMTTNLGPRVSMSTTHADPASFMTLHIPSAASLHVQGTQVAAGLLRSTSTVNLQSATLLSRATTASLTSLTLADGEWAIDNVSVTSCAIRFRSGNTTYTFRADAAAVV